MLPSVLQSAALQTGATCEKRCEHMCGSELERKKEHFMIEDDEAHLAHSIEGMQEDDASLT